MPDLYVRVDRNQIKNAVMGDLTAQPIAVHDHKDKPIHLTRRLPILLMGKVEIGVMVYDLQEKHAARSQVHLLLHRAELVDGAIHLGLDAETVRQLTGLPVALSPEEVLAFTAGRAGEGEGAK